MFQRFRTPTSTNITYAGANEAIGPNSISNVANQGKFLKNDGGTCVWVSLPLPDANTQTSDKDLYTLAYDYATKSFKLVYIKIPYNALQDNSIKWMYIPTAISTNFVSTTLTKINNLSLTGTTYDVSNITLGNNARLGASNLGLNLSLTRGPVLMQINNAFPATANYAFIFAFKTDYSINTVQSLLRTMANNGTDTNNDCFLLFQKTNSSVSSIDFNYSPTSQYHVDNVAIVDATNYIFTASIIGGIIRIFLNGLLISTATATSSFFSATDELLLLNGSTNSAFYNQFQPTGTFYAMTCLENATLSNIQRVEGWIKWNSPASGIPFTLDASHPFASQSPSLN